MKLAINLFCCLFIALHLQAQNQLSGKVLANDQTPIEFASVSIFPLSDSTEVIGVITNQAGLYELNDVASGLFQLTVQMLGYEDFSQQIDVQEKMQLEPIMLLEEATTLEEVQVVAYQSELTSHLGKKVLRIGQDLSSTGSNAIEALDNIPSVTTTPRGQVQIRGNSNVIIYINGKATRRDPSTLKFIAVESLDRIEIITNPSAKYDAEGVGGIINLVYKKDKINAFKLELTSNVSVLTNPFYLSPNGGINVSWTRNKISFFTNLSHDYGRYVNYVDSKRINFQDSLQRYENQTIQKGIGHVSNALVGCSIEPDSTLSIGFELNYDRWALQNDIEQNNTFDYKNAIDKTVNIPSARTEIENELWLNLSLEKKFSENQLLKVSLTAGGENEENYSVSEKIDLTESLDNSQYF